MIGLCPFHEDRNPSLVISPGKNLWHCLGACGEGGSVIDWVMKTHGVSFRHAVDDVEQAIDVANETLSALSTPVITRDVDSGLAFTASAPSTRTWRGRRGFRGDEIWRRPGSAGLLNDTGRDRSQR